MREIKFRGLTAKIGWVYGDLVNDLPNSTAYYSEYSQRICWFPETGGVANAPVKNGTVGEFTGLYDKNGKEIYEGDIIAFKNANMSEKEILGFVKYDPYRAVYTVYEKWEDKVFGMPLFQECDDGFCDPKNLEIVGNIYNKTELLQ